MTSCAGTPAEQFAASYVEGTLPIEEVELFEQHFFDCPVCFEQVKTLQATEVHFSEQRTLSPAVPSPVSIRRAPLAWLRPIPAFFALAAMALIAVSIYRMQGVHKAQPLTAVAVPPAAAPVAPVTAQPQADASAVKLADLALPPFAAANLRGQATDKHFEQGITAYSNKNCPAAVPQLLLTTKGAPEFIESRFYAGACQIRDRQLKAGSQSLEVVAAAESSPLREAALYHLAQAALASDDRPAARQYLNRTVALRGDLETRARTQLLALSTLDRSK